MGAGVGHIIVRMRIELVDERDIVQEVELPRFRVWVVEDRANLAVSVHEIVEATFDEVEAWAQKNAPKGYSIAVVRPVDDGLECIWLRGTDPNAASRPA